MPLTYDDIPGSWGIYSKDWPKIKIPQNLIDKIDKAKYYYPYHVVVYDAVIALKIPYGSYVVVDGFLRVETQEYYKKLCNYWLN